MADMVVSPATQRRTNSALWYGLLITLFGIISQFFYFLRPPRPITHVLPWLNLGLPAIGLIFLFIGQARAFRRSAVYSGKIWGSFVTVIALVLVAGNILLFEKTRDVPNSAGAPQIGQRLPEFTLSDSSGQPTSLSQLLSASADGSRPRAVLLVFLSRLLVTILRPRVTRHPEAASGIPGGRRSPSGHQRGSAGGLCQLAS
jgi:hypothetical protein